MTNTLTPDLPNELRTNLEYIREDTLGLIEAIRAARHLPIIMISAQDQIDYSHVMNKPLSVSRSSGLIPSDVIQLIQDVLEMTRKTAG